MNNDNYSKFAFHDEVVGLASLLHIMILSQSGYETCRKCMPQVAPLSLLSILIVSYRIAAYFLSREYWSRANGFDEIKEKVTVRYETVDVKNGL